MEKEGIFEGKWYAYLPIRNALVAGSLTGIAFSFAHLGLISSFAETGTYVIAILLGGYHWSREGIEKLLEEKETGVEILMLAATVGSAILGMWDEAAFLVFLYGFTEGLLDYTYTRTKASVKKLLDLSPKEARVLRNGRELVIPAEKLKVGDIFVVRPGESIPTDGFIVNGRSSINESPVTGESNPVGKKEGMKVFAGTINLEGALEIEATATFEDNTLSKIIHLVEAAQEQKGKTQLFIEWFGRKYTPLVLLSSLILVVIPPLLGLSFSYWATRAIVLLVAAAPCALAMSTPVAIAAGIGRAGRSGVLIKGGLHLENLAKVEVVAFDKTGTLTKGKPVVTDIIGVNGTENEILNLACIVEKYSEHPLGLAICERAGKACNQNSGVSDFYAIAGYGAKANVRGRTVYVGKQGLFKKFGQEVHSIKYIEDLRNEGKTVVLVGTEEGIEGIIAVRDEIRPQAKEVIEGLHKMGLKVIMLTGDSELTAMAIARELCIDDVRADLKPEDKVKAVKELEECHGPVAMVGDGINDAPALSQATVGIAMGTGGTDVAIESADITLMGDDLTKLLFALNLGKRARKIGIQNIIFSLLVLAVLIPSALIGVMTVATAVLVHETSELLAVVNGLRVTRGRI